MSDNNSRAVKSKCGMRAQRDEVQNTWGKSSCSGATRRCSTCSTAVQRAKIDVVKGIELEVNRRFSNKFSKLESRADSMSTGLCNECHPSNGWLDLISQIHSSSLVKGVSQKNNTYTHTES